MSTIKRNIGEDLVRAKEVEEALTRELPEILKQAPQRGRSGAVS